MGKRPSSEFEKAAAAQSSGGFLRDLWDIIKMNKKWWLVPIIAMLLIFGLLILLSSTGVAPFIYTMF